MTTNEACKSFYSGSHIPTKYRQTEATQHGNKNSSECKKATKNTYYYVTIYQLCITIISSWISYIFSTNDNIAAPFYFSDLHFPLTVIRISCWWSALCNGPDNYLSKVSISISPSTFTEDRDTLSRLNVMGLQCLILIRKWIKSNWSVILLNLISGCERVDTTFIHFKTHNFTQCTEIVILLRERIVT